MRAAHLERPLREATCPSTTKTQTAQCFLRPPSECWDWSRTLKAHGTGAALQAKGDVVYLLTPRAWAHRAAASDLGGTEYLAFAHGLTAGHAPHLDLSEEQAVQDAMLRLIHAQLVRSAHDISDGGLAVCLAEAAVFSGMLGATVDLVVAKPYRLDALLFGEAQSRIVFTTRAGAENAVKQTLVNIGAQAHPIGHVTRDRLKSS